MNEPAIVAAFDLDGTLTDGGSVYRWLRHVGGNARVWKASLRHFLVLAWAIARSGDAADHAKESLFFNVLRGRDADEVTRQSEQFASEHLTEHARTVYVDRLRWHLSEGHHVVVVSASPELYVRAIARELGAESAIGTRLGVDPLGRLTGGYLGRNCRGDEKLRRLDEWIAAQPWGANTERFAYGNSRGDRTMLRSADHAYDAGKLGRLGAMRSFDRLSTP